MSRARIIPSTRISSLLSRRHCASVLRPPSFLRTAAAAHARSVQPSISAARVGIHPNQSHLSLPAFAWRPFSTTPTHSSAAAPFTYSISASYSDKREDLNLVRNTFTYDPFQRIPRTGPAATEAERIATRPRSGQDAFFISSIGETSHMAFGVVDGVGGWEESDVDPADFAHSLCDYMSGAAQAYPSTRIQSKRGATQESSLQDLIKPVDILNEGYDRVMADASISAGGSTACIATASSAGLLNVANLGDSGYIHLSPFRLNYLSPAQTHRFNTPFQLSKLPPHMLKQIATFGGAKPYSETPKDAALTAQRLSHGDVIVCATDGVWDNLSAEDVLRLVTRVMTRAGAWVVPSEGKAAGVSPDFPSIMRAASIQAPPSRAKSPTGSVKGTEDATIKGLSAVLAAAITHEAKIASLDTKRDGPFAREVQRLYPGENWRGGKVDDICVVVALSVQEQA